MYVQERVSQKMYNIREKWERKGTGDRKILTFFNERTVVSNPI